MERQREREVGAKTADDGQEERRRRRWRKALDDDELLGLKSEVAVVVVDVVRESL